ncbi:hypothetical protein GWK47_047538 [Chionoecetes opilio]|uniref:Uncharacterized protein n=1 Tax=Chionoecetes opilio TaxID=41210 RepID=A0A8J5CVV7_CHIOP|nr:hypothetical protein GWK47_047538 [Chionoecetes opilio]
MNLCDLPALVQCVFQQVKPHLVVVTTPNADFDKFFPNHTPGKFRHWTTSLSGQLKNSSTGFPTRFLGPGCEAGGSPLRVQEIKWGQRGPTPVVTTAQSLVYIGQKAGWAGKENEHPGKT